LILLILVIFTAPRSWVTSAQPRQPQATEFAYAVLPQFTVTGCTTNWILALPVQPPKVKKKKKIHQAEDWLIPKDKDLTFTEKMFTPAFHTSQDSVL